MVQYFFYFPQKIITYFESQRLPFIHVILTFLATIILRNFAESFSQASVNYFNLPADILLLNFIHFTLSYIAGAISLLVLLYYATGVAVEKTARVILPSFMVLLLAPLLDLMISLGSGHNILYLGPKTALHPIQQFFTFFKDDPGITFGMRIEIICALYGIFSYIYLKRKKWFSAFIYTVLAYQIIFIFCAFPLILQTLSIKTHLHFSLTMVRFYAALIFFTGIWLAFLIDKTIFLTIIKDLRILRILHYQLMVFFGSSLACYYTHISLGELIKNPNSDWLVHLLFCAISITFAGLFSIITNNIADLPIDKISNPLRPLVLKAIDMKTYSAIGFYALFLSLSFALLAGFKAFFILIVIISTYYIYSVPPIRFKRVLFFSKLVISINSLALILLGYLLVTDHINQFPLVLVPIYLIGFTLSANFIDFKDHLGDQEARILTLPGVLGPKKAKHLIAPGFFLTYLSFYFLLKNLAWLPLLALGGAIQMVLVYKKCDQESLSFLLYLANMVGMIMFFLLA